MTTLQETGVRARRGWRSVVPARAARRTGDRDWAVAYSRWLLLADLVVLGIAFNVSEVLKFGLDSDSAATASGGVAVPYVVTSAVIVGGWWLSLQIYRTRSRHVLGDGVEEYRRVIRATVMSFGAFAIFSVAFKVDMSRAYIAVAFPLGLLGVLAVRKATRWHIHRRRRHGACLSPVLVVGTVESARAAAAAFARGGGGYVVRGVWAPPGTAVVAADDLEVYGADLALTDVLESSGASTLMVTHAGSLGHERLNRLAWDLVGTGVELVISPSVLGVAESRLHLRTVASMPLLHLEEPQYEGASRFAKRAFDLAGACLVGVIATPVMLLVALLVKATSRGPVFYAQERIGKDGQPFRMIKFRSMRQGADAELVALLDAQGSALGELPKVVDDPRITRVGRVIRRFSIDELPQLFNVVRGDMSLVGPRPQREFEVAEYDAVAHRRLAVRPGMTGLWQVSGRSGLEYDEAMRLDIFYVENWSLTADLIILWRTVRAVVVRDGAY